VEFSKNLTSADVHPLWLKIGLIALTDLAGAAKLTKMKAGTSMNLWDDGRSGAAGCLAGNLVLAHLRDAAGESFSERKGTTFFGSGAIWIGRMCSTDAYLYGRDRHWANLSLEQHREISHEAGLEGRSVKYLFITALAGQPVIHYWTIPGALVERAAFSDSRHAADYVYALHIREHDDGRFYLETEDVTEHHHVLPLNPASSSRLDDAFDATRRARQRREAQRDARRSADARQFDAATPREPVGKQTEFQIPLKGGRSALLQLPLPAADVDLARIKGWIDLMNDVLTESVSEEPSTNVRRERATRAVSDLQNASLADGRDRITDEQIDSEIRDARRGHK
jgi:hypothetical protein